MPRWASRLTLEITAVRVQRLQDITEEDAIGEGYPMGLTPTGAAMTPPILWYSTIWDSINGKEHRWKNNPWVWALTFKRVEVPQ